MPLHFALSAININQCWQIVPLYKEIIKRGHHADVYASVQNNTSFIPFNIENIPWEPFETTSPEDLQDRYDVVIESDRMVSDYGLKKTGFSIGFFPGGCGHWLTTGDNLPAIARHTLWIGHNLFEAESRLRQGYGGKFPIIGMPSLSNYKNYQKKASNKPLKGLYLNGPPFGAKNKKQFTRFLEQLAKKNPHIEIHIKERFLGKERPNHYELGMLELESIPNVHVYDGYASAVELVKEVDFMVGLSTTAFIEAMLIKKPVFIPTDFDTEYLYGVKTGDIYPQCLEGFTKLKSHELINKFDDCFENARKPSLETYLSNFPHQDPCRTIIDLAEIIHAEKGDHIIKDFNIDIKFEDLEQFRRDFKEWLGEKGLKEKRERNLYLMTVFSEVLRRVRYVVPGLPPEIYREFVHAFKKEYKESPEWQVAAFEKLGVLFYNFLGTKGGVKDEWLSPPGTLYDKYADVYLDEAKSLGVLT